MSLLDLEVIDLDVEIREGEIVRAKSTGNKVRDFDKVMMTKGLTDFTISCQGF